MKTRSRFLSRILRHEPQRIGIQLDDAGWVEVETLLSAANAHGTRMTREELMRTVAESDKKRFTLSPDGTRIRAAQGHSVPVNLGLAPLQPPEHLFHGTATRNLDAIRTAGLKPQKRQQVHLSKDTQTAIAVGKRYGDPHVLRVAAGQMHRNGHAFFQADNGVWLTDHVAPHYLEDA